MKKRSKALLTLACVACLVAGSVFGTLAYLTDQDAATNTFTVGNVDIKLDEADVNTDGTYVTNGDERVQENEYHLLPGHEYVKDPTVTVEAGSEDSYVRVFVTVYDIDNVDKIFAKYRGKTGAFELNDVVLELDSATWIPDGEEDAEKEIKVNDTTTVKVPVRTYELRYKDVVNGGDATGDGNKLKAVFTKLVMPEVLTNEDMEALDYFKVEVVAQAIQADGFESADEAWDAFEKQNP